MLHAPASTPLQVDALLSTHLIRFQVGNFDGGYVEIKPTAPDRSGVQLFGTGNVASTSEDFLHCNSSISAAADFWGTGELLYCFMCGDDDHAGKDCPLPTTEGVNRSGPRGATPLITACTPCLMHRVLREETVT